MDLSSYSCVVALGVMSLDHYYFQYIYTTSIDDIYILEIPIIKDFLFRN